MDEKRRLAEAEVDAQFLDRWSPRAFSEEPVPAEALRSLFEAARWAPSSANGQPWFFLWRLVRVKGVSAGERVCVQVQYMIYLRPHGTLSAPLCQTIPQSEWDREVFLASLPWALRAPVLIYLLCRRNWQKSGRPNDWAKFDAGAAWMSLALQARKLGLYAHAMAGFDREKAYVALNVPKEEFEIIAAIAVGYWGDPLKLPPDLQEREKPTQRKTLTEVYKMGRF